MEDNQFGSTLLELRKKHAITQKELAQVMHVHITTVKNWETGNCLPDAKNICSLADYFHVTTDYMLGRETSDTISLSGLTSQQRKQLKSIIQAYLAYIPQDV